MALGGENQASGDRPARAEFVWPPRPLSAEGSTAAPASSARADVAEARGDPRAGRLVRAARTALADAEQFWLEPEADVLSRRAASCGWIPDVFGVYCDRCGRTVGPAEADEFGCSGCRGKRLPYRRFVRLGEHDGELRRWIHEVKFTRWRRLGVDLGRVLGERLAQAGLAPGALTRPERLCVTPTPTTWRRRLARGVDHAAAIAAGVAIELQAPLVRAIGRRHRPSQLAVAPSARRRNVAGAFFPLWGVNLEGWTVVLVDDVRTTGATLRAASRALRAGRGKPEAIWAAVLATAREPDSLAGVRTAGQGLEPRAETGTG